MTYSSSIIVEFFGYFRHKKNQLLCDEISVFACFLIPTCITYVTIAGHIKISHTQRFSSITAKQKIDLKGCIALNICIMDLLMPLATLKPSWCCSELGLLLRLITRFATLRWLFLLFNQVLSILITHWHTVLIFPKLYPHFDLLKYNYVYSSGVRSLPILVEKERMFMISDNLIWIA